MASTHRRPNSPYWWGKFTGPDGRPIYRSTKQLKVSDARAVVDAWDRAAKLARNRELIQATSIQILGSFMESTIGQSLQIETIDSYLTKFPASRRVLGRTDSTSSRYEGIIKSFLTFLGSERIKGSIGSLTAPEIEKWRDAELLTGKGGTTVDLGIKILRAALESAKRKGLILANVADAVERVDSVSEERDPFSDDEVRLLLKTANEEWRGMILFGAHVGLRIADAANLKWNQIDLEAATLMLLRQKSQRSAPKPTLEALHSDIVEYLNKIERPSVPDAPLFPTLFGRKPGSHGGLSNEFSRLMAKAGIVVTLGSEKAGKGRRTRNKGFHALRHSMVTTMAQTKDIPDAVRKSLAGHSTDSAHKRYVHLGLDSKKAAISKIRSLIGKLPNKRV